MLKVNELSKIQGFLHIEGNPNSEVHEIVEFNEANMSEFALMWINDKNIDKLDQLNCGTVITSSLPKQLKNGVNYIVVENPRFFFLTVLRLFFVEYTKSTISKTACISSNVELGDGVSIGENVVIEKNVCIGKGTSIGHNTVIYKNTIIGENVFIGSNNSIGGVGFGYERDKDGTFVQIPHIGNVVIEDEVEIGNNTCIDRAVLGSTIIKRNTKIDNLVHIAHGAIIGTNSLIIANSMIAGSTRIGDNVWVSPSCSILNKLNVGDNVVIGMGAVVLKNVDENDIIAGIPAKSIKKL